MSTKTALLRAGNVRHSASPVLVGGPARPADSECTSDASVTEVRDDRGDIQEIHVTCECGKVTVISCQYATEARHV